jgi:undecaprenyl-diphosphatase
LLTISPIMTTAQNLIISIVEGLTEFLPISSTAHMRFTNPLVGIDGEAPFTRLFEVVIQLAAILAVVVLYWKKFMNFKRISFYLKLVIAVIPALVAGLLLKKYIDSALGNLTAIAWIMIGGGVVLLFIDRFFAKNSINEEEKISNTSAFAIGCFQVLSVLLPGLSRSAATIIGGMTQKLSRNLAAEFSFFLAVPTMLAASVKSFYDVYKEHPEVLVKDNMLDLLLGSGVAFIVALLAIKLFIGFVKKYGFRIWGIYRILIGMVMLILITKGIVR